MRKWAFNQGGNITGLFVPKRYFTGGPFPVQETLTDPKAGNKSLQQLAQNGGIENRAEPQPTSEQGKGADESRKSTAWKPLPLSPLMDPSYQAVKQKHSLRKAAPSKEPTPFQQQLTKNPYAQALATPVRMCAVTRAALPSFFLQDFEIISHPSTNERWYLPRSLTSPYASGSTDVTINPDFTQAIGIKRGPKVYTLSRNALIKGIRTPNSGFNDGEQRFHQDTAKLYKSFRATKIRWREDMDTFILDLMRRRIVEELKYLSGKRRGYLAGYPTWQCAKNAKQVGAFLWLGPGEQGKLEVDDKAVRSSITRVTAMDQGGQIGVNQMDGAEPQAEDLAATRQEEMTFIENGDIATGKGIETIHEDSFSLAPGEFATLDMGKKMRSKIPAYNLRYLLGDSYIRDLRQHRSPTEVFNNDVAVLKHRRVTIGVQLRLWKVQGYLAEYKSIEND